MMESGSGTGRCYDLGNCGLRRLRLRLKRRCSAEVSSWDCFRLCKSGSGSYNLNNCGLRRLRLRLQRRYGCKDAALLE